MSNIVKKLYGLIGFPLEHSFSKSYFTKKFQKEEITDSLYELFPLSVITDLPALLSKYPTLGGLNVTIPYKQQVLPYLNDTSALPINACNCIKIDNGKLIGFNTDIIGFEKSFIEKLQLHHNKALILGSGGASIAVQYVLKKLNIHFKIVGRSKSADFLYNQIDAVKMNEYNIIINTTPLGTYPKTESYPDIPYKFITPQHYCYDLVYNPEKSLFLQKAETQGAAIKNGYDMLTIQADESWKIWNR